MASKNIFLAALKKTYTILKVKNTDSIEVYHATLNPEVVKRVSNIDMPAIDNIIDNKISFFDLKNDQVVEIDLEKIYLINFPGLPFEVPPQYILNKKFEGRITQDEFIMLQESAFTDLKYIKSIQTSKELSNNIIPNDLIFKYTLLRHYYEKICSSDSKNEIFNDKELKKFKEKFKFFNIPDRQLFSNMIDECADVFNVNISNRILFYSKFVKDILSKKTGILVEDLNSTDEVLMEKCIKCWRDIIDQHAQEAVKNLEIEKNIFIENNPDSKIELDEINFVQDILKNLVKDIDFTKFKTPLDLFTFWPPVLYPAPEFVLDPYKFN